MNHPIDNPGEPRWQKEYEDPHFHDDSDFEQPEESKHRDVRPAASHRKPARRMPPPKRRYDED